MTTKRQEDQQKKALEELFILCRRPRVIEKITSYDQLYVEFTYEEMLELKDKFIDELLDDIWVRFHVYGVNYEFLGSFSKIYDYILVPSATYSFLVSRWDHFSDMCFFYKQHIEEYINYDIASEFFEYFNNLENIDYYDENKVRYYRNEIRYYLNELYFINSPVFAQKMIKNANKFV